MKQEVYTPRLGMNFLLALTVVKAGNGWQEIFPQYGRYL
jgi:hypothetical protein